LFGCVSAQLGPDRFNTLNSSLFLNTGYCKAPSGIYFGPGNFTFIVWVKLIAYGPNALLMDFGNGIPPNNNIIFCPAFTGPPNNPVFQICYGTTVWSTIIPSSVIALNVWNHYGVVLSGTTLRFYLNGSLVSTLANSYLPVNVNRTKNFIGQGSKPSLPSLKAYVDEMKIYNISLSSSQISWDYLN
jgi:hypothetical protein